MIARYPITIIRPTAAGGLFIRRRKRSRYSRSRRRHASESNRQKRCGRFTVTVPMATSQTDSGIEVRVEDIRNQVNQDQEDREDERRAHDAARVEPEDR